MATFVKIADFAEAIAEGEHNLATGALTIALSNVAPGSETSNPLLTGNGALANVTQIAYTNLPTSRVLAGVTCDESGGTTTLDATDITLTATGTVATFRYVYIYNDTPTTPTADPLIAHYDYGGPVDMANTETFDISFDVAGILTIA